MPTPEHYEPGFLESIAIRFFRATGFHLGSLLKFAAILLIGAVGIGWVLLNNFAENDAKPSGGVVSTRLTTEEKFREVNSIPSDFLARRPLEKMDIYNAKIQLGEELAKSGSDYAEPATKKLVFLYGARCSLEESEGLDSENSYRKLAGLRQEALAAGKDKLVAKIDFLRALAVTARLTERTEQADFRFAADTVSNLNGKDLLQVSEAKLLYTNGLRLFDNALEQDQAPMAAAFLSLLADKLSDSPENGISSLGLNLKDYSRYFKFYSATENLSNATSESKLQFYSELSTKIDKAPPQAPTTYRIILELIDRLLNHSDADTAKRLTERLSEAASTAGPEIKSKIDQSISNIETRLATLGKTIDLSGSTFDGSPLKLPNDKPTTLIFWRPTDTNSADYVVSLAASDRFDPWASNVLIVGPSNLSEVAFKVLGRELAKFTVLDNETSRRLAIDFGIDIVPYEISLDKDGKVLRLGKAIN